jgi:uncharacterized protein
MKKVIIAGASGVIGRALCRNLCKDYEIIALSRDAKRAGWSIGDFAKIIEWDGRTTGTWFQQANSALAIINLAGENVSSGRWNNSKKVGILQSRLYAARAIIAAVRQVEIKPSLVIQASAIGYYGPSGDKDLNENSAPGKGFLADVCKQVELCAEQIKNLDVRLAVIRTGVVLGSAGGALPKLVKPFKFFLGSYPGSGKQWFSWISLDDYIAVVRFILENDNQQGVFNLTSPQPVIMKDLCKEIGRVLHRPCWFEIPDFILRSALGEIADEMLLSGQKVLPEKLLAAGFEFKYPEIEKALKATYSKTD